MPRHGMAHAERPSTVPIPELKAPFPLGTQIKDAESEYALYVYEIEPIDSETLLFAH